MRHIKSVSKSPSRAQDIPISDLMAFIVAILSAVAALLAAKEATTPP
jgi:hypothetical protein